MQKIVIALAIIIAFVGLMKWTADRDQKLMAWAEKYEECVREEYRTTPTAWYAEHGEYPYCDVTNK